MNVSVTSIDEATEPKTANGARTDSETGQAFLTEALACGIIQLKLGTLKWKDELTFTGTSRFGGDINGEITKVENNRVYGMKYKRSEQPEHVYQVDYDYSDKTSQSPIPDRITFSFVWKSVPKVIERISILKLNITNTALPVAMFQPSRLPN